MGWHGRLELHYSRRDGERTVAHDRHDGPLRVLQPLHPEGPGICHHVLVHPPGGIVGGDRLELDVRLDAGTHALITTPGATRFYRSGGDAAAQQAALHIGDAARLEWLPLEAIAYPGCIAENGVRFELAPTAETCGWDLLALGLPAADAAWDRGRYLQCIEWPGVWLERGRLDAQDRRLLDSPLGLAGRCVLATMWFAAGSPLAPARREALLDTARAAADALPAEAGVVAGATSPDERLVLLRLLAHRVEPAMALLQSVRAVWRQAAWQLPPCPPRVWRT